MLQGIYTHYKIVYNLQRYLKQTKSMYTFNINVILRAKDVPSQHVLRHEFIKRLKRRYEEEGIKIPFPIREVYLRPLSKE